MAQVDSDIKRFTTSELIEELKERSGCYGFDRSALGFPEIHFSFLKEEWDYEGDGF